MSEVKMTNIKYMYVRNMWKNRDITIVSNLIEKDDKTFVQCGWTFRHSKDKQFIKREGRKIALERMNNQDKDYSATFEIEKQDAKFFKICAGILSQILEKETTPNKYKNDIADDLYYFAYFSTNDRTPKECWETISS